MDVNVVEVDVKLFVTCRMCLDEPGVYQIVPSLRTLIKFCFDLDIEPFDGLPQLICKKCKSTLCEYHDTKTTFLKKQQELARKLLPKKKTPIPKAKSNHANNEDGQSSNPPVDTLVPETNKHNINNGESPISPTIFSNGDVPQHDNKQNKPMSDSWKKDYNKHFVCKICCKSYKKLSSIKRHISCHRDIFKKNKKIFGKYCIVQLNKVDDKPNSTGCLNNVVYDKSKVILDKGNSRYHSFYLKKYNDSDDDRDEGSGVKRRAILSDSEEEICKGKRKRNTRRLFSSSSTQTTVLEDSKAECETEIVTELNTLDNSESENLVHAECINTEDTPTESATNNKLDLDTSMSFRQQKPVKANITNYKAIQSIVTMCQKKYMKKVQSETDTLHKPAFCEYSLKRKILSLGRKVINKQGFGCTGLLRYMEHKNLHIKWQPAIHKTQNKVSSFVRIMPKMKSRLDSENDDSGWRDVNVLAFLNERVDSDTVDKIDNLDTALVPKMETINEEIASCPPDLSNEDEVSTNTNSDYYNNKLLNKTPVANPKQLLQNISNDSPAMQSIANIDQIKHEEVEDNNFGLPIILSTKSLSNIAENGTDADAVPEIPAPRIKVKPASELMSERALINQATAGYIKLPITNSTVYVSPPMCQSQVTNHQPVNHVVTIVAESPADNSPIHETNLRDSSDKHLEIVTLNSLELPNTKTDSPFQYFGKVLLHHGLILKDINDEIPAHFNCLIKFKLLLKQGTKQPLGVVLSLFCSNNEFCLNFKDSKLKNFDPNQLPAFWQWELLKVYKGSVANRILQNAVKINKEVHEHTKNFLCLLKSINLIT